MDIKTGVKFLLYPQESLYEKIYGESISWYFIYLQIKLSLGPNILKAFLVEWIKSALEVACWILFEYMQLFFHRVLSIVIAYTGDVIY